MHCVSSLWLPDCITPLTLEVTEISALEFMHSIVELPALETTLSHACPSYWPGFTRNQR